jgi:hypothetical protein
MYVKNAFANVRADSKLLSEIKAGTGRWMALKMKIAGSLPDDLQNKEDLAQDWVPRFMNEQFGIGKWGTKKLPKKSDPNQMTSYFELKP